MRKLLLVLTLIISLFSCSKKVMDEEVKKVNSTGITLGELQTNYQTTPLGTDLEVLQFSWQMKALNAKRGYKQIAYQINVSDEDGQVVWDSGKTNTDLAHGITYAGKSLQPTTRYTWKVTVWDNFGDMATASSWFETGFLDPSIDAWSGAEWIGGGDDDLVFYAPYQSVFKFHYTIQLDASSQSNKASFVFGANDFRLMDKDLNLMGVENKEDESYIAIELDISKMPAENAMLNIYRVGYTSEDSEEIPLKSLEIPEASISNTNKYDSHQILVECNFGMFEFYVNGADADHKLQDPDYQPSSPWAPRGVNLNPVGMGNNFISFPMVAEIGFKTGPGQTASFSDIQIRNLRYPSNILFTETPNSDDYDGIFQQEGISIKNGKYIVAESRIITADPSKNAAPMLRSEFDVEKPITKARLYITSRGIYEAYINGNRVSDDYFNPGVTQYNLTHMYQTYDVTDALVKGNNVIGVWLGEGWWSGNITYSGENWNFFGDKQSVLAKMIIEYTDGTELVITSNDKDWQLFTDGPIRCGSFFQGEAYDATKEMAVEGWTTAAYDDSDWKKAVIVPLDGSAFKGTFPGFLGSEVTMKYDQMKLLGQMGKNATVVKELTATSVQEVRENVYVYDMGQNMVGIPQIKIKNGKRGQKIIIRYAEVTYPDLSDYEGNEGMVMMENIRAALAHDTYILKGGDEVIQPRFTFHGYRYLEITGLEGSLPVSDVKGLVISSVHELASSYKTNHPLVNKLWENITWSLRSNFLSIPTDCPARNERMGWSGDISVFSRSATFLTDANMFLRRHMLAMRDMQEENGRFADVAPVGGGFGGTLWGSAGIVVAWETYRQYGDVQLLEEHYDAMKRYVLFLESKVDPETGILNEGPLGDWLSPEGNKNDNTLFWMSYFYYDLDIMRQIATILDKNNDALYFNNLGEQIKNTFNKVYVDQESHRTVKSGVRTGFMSPPNESQGEEKSDKGQLIDTQASYAIPLALNIFNEKNKPYAIQYLRETVSRKNTDDMGVLRPKYSLMTGFIGTASVCQALSENGSDDLAYRLLVQEKYPSWLYSVVNGATSIWERLNSYTVEDGFGGNNSMNSFNHYSFGSVAAWMYNHSLGIQRHPHKAGFKEFVLRPSFDPNENITEAKGYYDSLYGRIISEWKNDDGIIEFNTEVPSNTSAILYLPASDVNDIKEGGQSISSWENITFSNGEIMIPLGSGEYSFEINME